MLKYLKKSISRLLIATILSAIGMGMITFAIAIGYYNYQKAIADLQEKTKNTTTLSTLILSGPVWNFDKDGIQAILNAAMLDKDLVAIRIEKHNEKKIIGETYSPGVTDKIFDQTDKKNQHYFFSEGFIQNEGATIAKLTIATSTDKVYAFIYFTTILIAGFTLFILALIFFLVYKTSKRLLQQPIDALKNSADILAQGNMAVEISTARDDELGSLSKSFETMRNSIVKKIHNLSTLNGVGQNLSLMRSQTDALTLCIETMNRQFGIERGSIYLINNDGQLALSACYPLDNDHANHHATPKTFELSEGIAGRVASEGKIVFIPDVSKDSSYCESSTSTPKESALLCVPMMDGQKIFGVMNFIGSSNAVTFCDEDHDFASTLARITISSIKNIQMVNVIEEQNLTLEKRILARTSELNQKTKDINNMLQNLKQGIFTITKDGTIHPEHSAYLCEIFETQHIANANAMQLIFSHSNINEDRLSQISATIDGLLGEDRMNFEFNSHLLPTEYTNTFASGALKVLELDWNPVLDANDVVDKLMVTSRDVTELKRLQSESDEQRKQLEIVGQILSISKKEFTEFISSSLAMLSENETTITSSPEKSKATLDLIYRNMHTIKGNARTYGFDYISNAVHKAENTYSKIRDQDAEWNPSTLLEEIQEVLGEFNAYQLVFTEKLGGYLGESSGGKDFSHDLLAKISAILTPQTQDGIQDNDAILALNSIKKIIHGNEYESFDATLSGIISAVAPIAKQLGKETPVVNLTHKDIHLKKNIAATLRNVLMHVFRNSLDHGLESSTDRLAKGKNIVGQINLDATIDNNTLFLSIHDDGKGLPLDFIQTKAIESGKISNLREASDEEIANLIFESGLSTAANVTEISGRGVGMDAVKHFLHASNAEVNIEFTGPKNDGHRPFKLLIIMNNID